MGIAVGNTKQSGGQRRRPDDIWKTWLLHHRDVSDANREQVNAQLRRVRDRVLQNARLAPGNTVLDVGVGTGLIAFGALEGVLPDGKVIFSDISEACLDHCREIAAELGLETHCEFVLSPMEDLSAIGDETIDVVTTRSVLIYSSAKQTAFSEFYRVLRRRGRLSMFEPINKFSARPGKYSLGGYDIEPIRELVQKVILEMKKHSGDATETLTDFDERDLLAFAENSGFGSMRLEFEASVVQSLGGLWEHFYNSRPNPLALSLQEAAANALTDDERERFESYLLRAMNTQVVTKRTALAYFIATKG